MKEHDAEVLAAIRAIQDRTGATLSQLAALCGISPCTMRGILVAGMMPGRTAPREALARFVTTNREARCRTDLRIAR
jgi:DNA-directed RNA polymerase sigma subunit (sigma70/sigma32)